MKKITLQSIIIAAVIFNVLFVLVGPVCAELCDMGGMTIDGYALYIAFLGIACALAFIIGLNQ